MARAAAASGLPYILSTMATSSIQEVAEAVAQAPQGGWPADPNLWFQVRLHWSGGCVGSGQRKGLSGWVSCGGWEQACCAPTVAHTP